MAAADRPRIAFFSPLPPVQSGIAQYSAELLPLLGQALSLDLFLDDYRPTPPPNGPARLLPASRFAAEQRRRAYDLIIYQMGNSPAHAYMWPLIGRYPGLLVLHDYVLHHLWLWLAVNRRGSREYRAEMRHRYGAAGDRMALQTLRGQMPAEVFDCPLCERLIEQSLAVAAHSRFAADLIAARLPGRSVEVIPMGLPLYRLPVATAARHRLGLPPTAPLIVSLGHVSPHKRLDVVLRAVRRLRHRYPTLMLVIAGSESPGLDLDRQIRMLDLGDAVRRLGYLPEASVPDLLAAADLVVQLRFPTAGETSASLLRIMAAARPIITSRAGAMAEIPLGVVAQVAPDRYEEEMLVDLIDRLLTDAPLRHALAAAAGRFVEREHSLPLAADRYLAVIGRLIGRPLPAPAWSSPLIDARQGGPTLARPSQPPPPATRHPDWLADRLATELVALGLDRLPAVLTATATATTALGLAPAEPPAEPPTADQ